MARETKCYFIAIENRVHRWDIKIVINFYVKTEDPLCFEYVTCNSCRHTLPNSKHLLQVPESFGGVLEKNCSFLRVRQKMATYCILPTYSRQIYWGLSWMVRRYYIQDYPEYFGSVLDWAKNSLENNVSHFAINRTV